MLNNVFAEVHESTPSLSVSHVSPVRPDPSSPTVLNPTTSTHGRPPHSSAKYFTPHVLPSATTRTTSTTQLRPTPGISGCEETVCDCQFRLDQLTVGKVLKNLHLLIVLAVFVSLCALLCCCTTACCIQCCKLRRLKRSKKSKLPTRGPAKAASDENIYSDVVPPRGEGRNRHSSRHEENYDDGRLETRSEGGYSTRNEGSYAVRNEGSYAVRNEESYGPRHEARRGHARRKISTATVHGGELAYAEPEYSNSEAYRQQHATHTF